MRWHWRNRRLRVMILEAQFQFPLPFAVVLRSGWHNGTRSVCWSCVEGWNDTGVLIPLLLSRQRPCATMRAITWTLGTTCTRRVWDAMSLSIGLPDACWRYSPMRTACVGSPVSLVVNETRMCVTCKLTNEVESDATDDDAFDCLDSGTTLRDVLWSQCDSRWKRPLVLRSRRPSRRPTMWPVPGVTRRH